MIPFTPGDRVIATDGRTGVVKSLDWGGVYVDVNATTEQGRQVGVYRENQLTHDTEGE